MTTNPLPAGQLTDQEIQRIAMGVVRSAGPDGISEADLLDRCSKIEETLLTWRSQAALEKLWSVGKLDIGWNGSEVVFSLIPDGVRRP